MGGRREGVGGGRSTGRAAGQHNLRGGKGRCFVHAQAGRPGSVSADTARSTLAAVGGDRVRALHMCFTGRPRPTQAAVPCAAGQDLPRRRPVAGVVAVRRNNGAPGIDKTTLAWSRSTG